MKKNVAVVLVEPQGPLNIGSVCRAMMNFGFNDLRLVNPQTDHLCEDAFRMAVKAKPVLESAVIYPDLKSAIADAVMTVGTTRRFGKYREDFVVPAQAGTRVAESSSDGTVAMIFGREDKGLLTSELDLCQLFLTIPTDKELPSMNLAQAVSLCLYEVSNGFANPTERIGPPGPLPLREELENMYDRMRKSLVDIEFLNEHNPDHILRAFRRIFSRAVLNRRDVKVLQGLWRKLDWWVEERKRLQGEIDKGKVSDDR